MFDINFNGSNSFEDLGLVIEHRPLIPIPQKNITQITVPGRDGSLTQDDGTYGDIEIPIDFWVVNNNNLHEVFRSIRKWLIGDISDNRLILSDDTEYHYKVKSVKAENVERSLIVLGRFTATFLCEPFVYSNDEELMTLTSPSTIFNPESFGGKPHIKVFGTGDIDLTINGKEIRFTGVQDYIELDSEVEECYKDSSSLNNRMTGDFPVLNGDEIPITWSGSVTKIEITPRWRWI